MFARRNECRPNFEIASGSLRRSLSAFRTPESNRLGPIVPLRKDPVVRVHETLLGNPLLIPVNKVPQRQDAPAVLVFGSSTSPRNASAGSL